MRKNLSILIIEDDKYFRLNLRNILTSFGVIDEASHYEEALKKIQQNQYDLVITDIDLGHDQDSLNLIKIIHQKKTYCIVASSMEDDGVIEKAYDFGARHFLSKQKINIHLPLYLNKFFLSANNKINDIISKHFITQDESLKDEIKKLCEINWHNQCLYLSGETGSGKSLLGKIIHQCSHSEKNLVHLNCSEISENLLESELFGYEKGAFTGAEQKRDGKLLQANGGTLFLDEIGTMSMKMQQKLLKAIDEKTFYPVGATTPKHVEFTLISASCEDIKEKIRKKEFREDLFYRISGFQFHLPALRERTSDIAHLFKYFQQLSTRKFVLKKDASELIQHYSWPGNIRELKKVCDRLSQESTGIIDKDTIKKILQHDSFEHSLKEQTWEVEVFTHGLRKHIANIERQAVEKSLQKNKGKITASIKDLGISNSAFYRIVQENKISVS